MLRKIGVPVIALAAILTVFSPHKASGAVRFGVYVGAPAYPVYPAYPAYPAYPYPQYAYPDYYGYPPVYDYAVPAPYVYRNDGWWRNHERHEWMEHHRHEWRRWRR
jgi:hypothetical protein